MKNKDQIVALQMELAAVRARLFVIEARLENHAALGSDLAGHPMYQSAEGVAGSVAITQGDAQIDWSGQQTQTAHQKGSGPLNSSDPGILYE